MIHALLVIVVAYLVTFFLVGLSMATSGDLMVLGPIIGLIVCWSAKKGIGLEKN